MRCFRWFIAAIILVWTLGSIAFAEIVIMPKTQQEIKLQHLQEQVLWRMLNEIKDPSDREIELDILRSIKRSLNALER